MLSHDENSERNTVDRVQVNNGGAKVEVIAVQWSVAQEDLGLYPETYERDSWAPQTVN